jgi:hypothetical protein
MILIDENTTEVAEPGLNINCNYIYIGRSGVIMLP